MARSTVPRSVVGGTTTCAVPANRTRATLNRGGNDPTNSFAASWAAVRRLGSTSLASMDRDTSMATAMVARSLGTDRYDWGWAKARTRHAVEATDDITASHRFQPRWCGSTRRSRSSGLRTERCRMSSTSQARNSSTGTMSHHSRPGRAKCMSIAIPTASLPSSTHQLLRVLRTPSRRKPTWR